jgi:hypothetical protein
VEQIERTRQLSVSLDLNDHQVRTVEVVCAEQSCGVGECDQVDVAVILHEPESVQEFVAGTDREQRWVGGCTIVIGRSGSHNRRIHASLRASTFERLTAMIDC